MKKSLILLFSVSFFILLSSSLCNAGWLNDHKPSSGELPLVKRHQRTPLLVTENGEISAVKISDGTRGPYHLQFITLDPNSLFLPVLLHADMVFFVDTGSGTLNTVYDDEVRQIRLKRGDVYRLHPGSVFYIQSNLEEERKKLRIYAIFSNTDDNLYDPSIGAYSSISDLVLGFGDEVLGSAFKIPEEVLASLRNAKRPPGIVHALPQKKTTFWELEARLLKALVGSRGSPFDLVNSKIKKIKAYNILDEDPDFKNCHGWSLTVDRKDFKLLKDSNIGVFVVNLKKGSMMGPHWNPMATEISIVLHGQGMIRVVCSSSAKESGCKSMRFRVKKGDAFAVARFHPMAQMSFNNDSFVFMGFSTTPSENHPQFLTGKNSVLQTLNKKILATSFNVSNSTIDQLLIRQKDSIILDCNSCAEEEAKIMEREIEKARKEEEARKRREEEETKRREEEAAARKKREEERKREEEAAKRQEEERKREEEDAKRQEEERKREREEAKRQEEEREKRERQQEEERKRQEEERQRQEKEREQEEARKREQEERERQKQEEQSRQQEEARKQEEAEAREKEEARKREEEKERKAREEEEEARKKREGQGGQPEDPREKQQQEPKRQQEEAAAREQEQAKRQREGQGGQPKGPREKQQQEPKRQQEEAAAREQEQAKKQREGQGGQPEGPRQKQQQEPKRQQEEAAAREQEQAKKQREGQGGQPEGPRGKQQQEQQRQQEEAAAREQEAIRERERQGGGAEVKAHKTWKMVVSNV